MSLSTHVLDAALGRPAAGIPVRLECRDTILAEAVTDDDGRVLELGDIGVGSYRLVFDTATYFAGRPSFYPEVIVAFTVVDAGQHHHVPLLLAPFAYSTYRGS